MSTLVSLLRTYVCVTFFKNTFLVSSLHNLKLLYRIHTSTQRTRFTKQKSYIRKCDPTFNQRSIRKQLTCICAYTYAHMDILYPEDQYISRFNITYFIALLIQRNENVWRVYNLPNAYEFCAP